MKRPLIQFCSYLWLHLKVITSNYQEFCYLAGRDTNIFIGNALGSILAITLKVTWSRVYLLPIHYQFLLVFHFLLQHLHSLALAGIVFHLFWSHHKFAPVVEWNMGFVVIQSDSVVEILIGATERWHEVVCSCFMLLKNTFMRFLNLTSIKKSLGLISCTG